MNRKLKFFLIFLGVVIFSFGIYRFFPKSFSAINGVPQEFADANQNATLISQKIVDFSNTAADDLAKINNLDSQGKYVDALNLTSEAFDQNLQMRNQAVALSDELGKMTRALSQVASFEARQSALESISDRLAMVNKLINYSDYLNQLLLDLRLRFANQKIDRAQIEDLINQLNSEIRSINALNDQASSEINQFNKITQ